MSGRPTERPGEIRFVRSADGAQLEYEIVGAGPPLVMLHGILSGRASFSRQRAELADHHRLILLSARGHDGSEAILPTNYGVGSSGVDDLQTLLDVEGIDRASLFGHSGGGVTAFVFACRSPERVERVVLIEPTLLSILPPSDRAPVEAAHKTIAAAAEEGGPEAGVRALMASVGGEAWSKLDAETQAKRVQSLAKSAPMVGPHARGLLDLKVTDADIAAFRTPVLFFNGTKSAHFEGIIANRFRALRPDIESITIEGAGHNVHRDRPDIVNPAALSFLESASHAVQKSCRACENSGP
jgi:pimeloyl-ACP methyl ester carboxylesterase